MMATRMTFERLPSSVLNRYFCPSGSLYVPSSNVPWDASPHTIDIGPAVMALRQRLRWQWQRSFEWHSKFDQTAPLSIRGEMHWLEAPLLTSKIIHETMVTLEETGERDGRAVPVHGANQSDAYLAFDSLDAACFNAKWLTQSTQKLPFWIGQPFATIARKEALSLPLERDQLAMHWFTFNEESALNTLKQYRVAFWQKLLPSWNVKVNETCKTCSIYIGNNDLLELLTDHGENVMEMYAKAAKQATPKFMLNNEPVTPRVLSSVIDWTQVTCSLLLNSWTEQKFLNWPKLLTPHLIALTENTSHLFPLLVKRFSDRRPSRSVAVHHRYYDGAVIVLEGNETHCDDAMFTLKSVNDQIQASWRDKNAMLQCEMLPLDEVENWIADKLKK